VKRTAARAMEERYILTTIECERLAGRAASYPGIYREL
jgi:hypothetical protein